MYVTSKSTFCLELRMQLEIIIDTEVTGKYEHGNVGEGMFQ